MEQLYDCKYMYMYRDNSVQHYILPLFCPPPSILIPYRMYLLGYFHLSRNKRPRSSSISCTKEQLLGYVVHIYLILFLYERKLTWHLEKESEYCRNTSHDHYIVYFNIIKFSQPKPKSRKITKTSISIKANWYILRQSNQV